MLRLLKTPMAQQIDKTVEEWEAKNSITSQSYEQISKMHYCANAKH